MIRKLLAALNDGSHALLWQLRWRLGRTPGRAAVLALTCTRCDAVVQAPLTRAGRYLRLHNKAHRLMARIEAETTIPDFIPDDLIAGKDD